MTRKKLTREEQKAIIERYSIKLERMEDIAKTYGKTRECIWKMLVRKGVDTSKAQRIKRQCRVCGIDIYRRRGRARETEYSYCSADCYHTYLETLGEDYKPNSYYARKSREEVAKHFVDYDPKKGHTTHHVDKDVSHWHLKNLEVYASQGDHLKMHRGQDIKPIWRGID
jgi:hypothetical protein